MRKLSENLQKQSLIALLLFITVTTAAAENRNQNLRLTGSATLTSNGLSTFPNLTLGKPAAVFDFTIGGERFRLDPILRFGLDGKPWTFIFWLRYDAIKTEKFGLRFGAHPAYAFRTIQSMPNGQETDILRTYQFLAGEIAPIFRVTKNISLGPYYILAHGVDKDVVRFSNFLSFMTNISNIQLTEKIYSNLMAQVYFLKMDDSSGIYYNSTLSLNKRNFPVSLSSTINKAIDSNIPGEKFLWNINLSYRFGGVFRPVLPN